MTVASQVKQTLASLKNAQATLQLYAIQSQDPGAQSVFDEASRITGEIRLEVAERLKTLEFEEPQYKGL
ncbi:uncharacterized protein DUF1657 [Hydrogenispora ethanolica]|jgi:hypothetical protein|uniref:Uncharacterized protein DUF1657 n=1 Tax=Hydrogenispora ethanolica TaxID=1082276 RepID=A0A4R1RN61_HYDET|nr:DUF1657 domain-containing protein [Hydrogenispora ethanolica]TCL67340.1 uncharacterized protein DUF1657 [Hydrogenispora ethanolica]